MTLRGTCNFGNKYLHIFIRIYLRAWDEYNSKRIRIGLTGSGILKIWASDEADDHSLPTCMYVLSQKENKHTYKYTNIYTNETLNTPSSDDCTACGYARRTRIKKDDCMEAIKLCRLKVNLAIIY